MGKLIVLPSQPKDLIRRRRVEALLRLQRAVLETQAAMHSLFAAHQDPDSAGSLSAEVELLDRTLDHLRETIDKVEQNLSPAL